VFSGGDAITLAAVTVSRRLAGWAKAEGGESLFVQDLRLDWHSSSPAEEASKELLACAFVRYRPRV